MNTACALLKPLNASAVDGGVTWLQLTQRSVATTLSTCDAASGAAWKRIAAEADRMNCWAARSVSRQIGSHRFGMRPAA